MNHLCLTACHISVVKKKKKCVCAYVCVGRWGGGLSMFTKPVKVPMREQWNLPLFSRESLAVMIHLLTHQNRNHFLSSPFMPYERSVRYISLVLKYCYLETRCWVAALSLFDKLNFIVNCGNPLYASCLVLSLGSGYRETIVLFLKATSAGMPIILMYSYGDCLLSG